MNAADKEISRDERDASPGRFQQFTSTGEAIERAETHHTHASSISSASSVARPTLDVDGMSRFQTENVLPGDMQRNETVMSRIQTARSQHSGTVGSNIKSRKTTTKALPAFGGGKPYPPAVPDREEYVVEFDGHDDPLHAQNWPMKRKLFTGAMLGYTTFVAAFGSSIFSAATIKVASVYGVSAEVGTLGVSLYVLGFATGPIIWAPFSELRGRRLPLVIASGAFSIFQIAVAVGKDLQTVLICRFWGGFFGACPLTVVAAVFSDMFDNRTRGLAVSLMPCLRP